MDAEGAWRVGQLRRAAAAALIGTAIEFYDFFIYGTAAALVFGVVFFPGLGAVGALLAAFSVYAVAFLARPLGAVVFGHFGDRVGRKATLVVSLLLMGLATAAVGLLPGFAAWGWWAPAVLVVLRVCQGVGLGGEWGGAALLIAENAPAARRGRYGGFLQLGPTIGFVLANGVFLALQLGLGERAFRAWGWRVPFLASFALVAVGLFVRLRIEESPLFRAMERTEERGEKGRTGSGCRCWRWCGSTGVRWWRVGARSPVGYALFYLTTTYSLAYATSGLGVASTLVLAMLLVGAVGMAGTVWLSAERSDRWGRRRTLRWATGLAAGWALVLFPLLESVSRPLMFVALAGAMVVLGCMFGPVAAFLPELFPTRVRYTGAALTYNLGGVVGGALTPLVATRLMAAYGTAQPVGWYLAGLGVLALGCLRLLPETTGAELGAVDGGRRRAPLWGADPAA
ncbi:putative MFS family arabinose efflux permease [Streptomyces sp. 1114.5]|uniref:MFS transporter n=1 Tax=Streptomyces sp. 1114.5 TaxID=1938830 RepID=UPI000F1298EA|nr:MFS transporter [Streptomyces sp. 1114.5]RKT16222.1 putative MFS family arabinose efflux permease [Streptomyces sp. 1114.5]